MSRRGWRSWRRKQPKKAMTPEALVSGTNSFLQMIPTVFVLRDVQEVLKAALPLIAPIIPLRRVCRIFVAWGYNQSSKEGQ